MGVDFNPESGRSHNAVSQPGSHSTEAHIVLKLQAHMPGAVLLAEEALQPGAPLITAESHPHSPAQLEKALTAK